METNKWEKFKKQDKLAIITIDEIILFIIGLFVFLVFIDLKVFFIILVILWYWFKIRYYETKIIDKKREIYNVYYDNIKPIGQKNIDEKTEIERIPLKYDLEQLKNYRRFLIDKFVVLNLILILLIELFIKK